MIGVADELVDMAQGVAPVHDRRGDGRGQTEVIAKKDASDPENAQGEISKRDFLLEGASRQPADTRGNLVGAKHVSRKLENARSSNRDAEPVDQKYFHGRFWSADDFAKHYVDKRAGQGQRRKYDGKRPALPGAGQARGYGTECAADL